MKDTEKDIKQSQCLTILCPVSFPNLFLFKYILHTTGSFNLIKHIFMGHICIRQCTGHCDIIMNDSYCPQIHRILQGNRQTGKYLASDKTHNDGRRLIH